MQDSIIDQAIQELVRVGIIFGKENVLDAGRVFVPKAYPAYHGSYARFDVVRQWLDRIPDLWCIGQNGQHRYNNMDHVTSSSKEEVRQILSGRRLKDPGGAVNTEEEQHESKTN